jgi:hypothetical protein
MNEEVLLGILSVLITGSLSSFEFVSVDEYADRIELRLE